MGCDPWVAAQVKAKEEAKALGEKLASASLKKVEKELKKEEPKVEIKKKKKK